MSSIVGKDWFAQFFLQLENTHKNSYLSYEANTQVNIYSKATAWLTENSTLVKKHRKKVIASIAPRKLSESDLAALVIHLEADRTQCPCPLVCCLPQSLEQLATSPSRIDSACSAVSAGRPSGH